MSSKQILLVRHCSAQGQHPEAELTAEGKQQAIVLAKFLSTERIDRIISSPFIRAKQSIQPLAYHLNMEIEIDHRLEERILSKQSFDDWMDKLKRTFEDPDLKYVGGESLHESMLRGLELIHDVLHSNEQSTVLVSHGGLISSILRSFLTEFGFDEWSQISNPDVFKLSFNGEKVRVLRIWSDENTLQI